ncbi:STM3941 family protein [Niabella sp. 22666]|uniref:STM3941 family protein n=1 Tax=Niabella sp. 22666 TaxID=3453954 RepID=UPI003F84362F
MVIKVPIDKSKAIKRFAVFVILLLVFTLMAIQPQLFTKSSSTGFIKVAGFIGSFIFIIGAAFIAQKVFNKKPGLVIDNEGIADGSLGVMFPKLSWEQVTEIRHLESNGDHFIKVTIKDPEKYMATELNPLKRKMLEMNYNTLRTPVNIAASRLKIDFQELYTLIKSKREEFKNN